MDHLHDSDIPDSDKVGFRLSWPGHGVAPAGQAKHGDSLLERLPLVGEMARRRSCTGWPVKLSSPRS